MQPRYSRDIAEVQLRQDGSFGLPGRLPVQDVQGAPIVRRGRGTRRVALPDEQALGRTPAPAARSHHAPLTPHTHPSRACLLAASRNKSMAVTTERRKQGTYHMNLLLPWPTLQQALVHVLAVGGRADNYRYRTFEY